jgi:RNA polymerase sigma-70 factor (ECF subfamily)
MSDSRSDEDLMISYAAGAAAAFDELHARYRQRLWRYLAKLVREPALVEELYQETWERLIAARDRYRPEAPFGAYLFRIAYRLALDLLRKQRPQVSIDEQVVELVADQPDPSQWLAQLADAERLREALAELPHEQRAALLLQIEEELSLDQIAQISDCGRETIKSRLRYAMNRLRGRLRSEGA